MSAFEPSFTLSPMIRVVPGQGEDLGNALREAAHAGQRPTVRAELYYLAARAFEIGASASIGHGRADRYREEARGCRKLGDEVVR